MGVYKTELIRNSVARITIAVEAENEADANRNFHDWLKKSDHYEIFENEFKDNMIWVYKEENEYCYRWHKLADNEEEYNRLVHFDNFYIPKKKDNKEPRYHLFITYIDKAGEHNTGEIYHDLTLGQMIDIISDFNTTHFINFKSDELDDNNEQRFYLTLERRPVIDG